MYELSDDEKRKIREEEEAAVERERYRSFVRHQMNSGAEELPPSHQAKPKVEYFVPWGRVIAFTIVVALLVVIGSKIASSSGGGKTATAGSFQKLITETIPVLKPQTISIKPGQVTSYRINVQDNMKGAYLDGKFDASGGFGNDVEVVVGTDEEFKNWVNGHQASLAYASGKKSAGVFRAQLEPGLYRLGISNGFSLLSDKMVKIEADLNFKRFIAF